MSTQPAPADDAAPDDPPTDHGDSHRAVDGPGSGISMEDATALQVAELGVPGPRSEIRIRDNAVGNDEKEPKENERLWKALRSIRTALSRVCTVSVYSLVIALIGLGVAFQPDQFQRVVADYYGASVQTDDEASSDGFVDKIVSVSDRGWFTKRIIGTRVQFDEVDIDNGAQEPLADVKEGTDDKPGVLQIPTRECPDGRGQFVRIFVHQTMSGQFGTLNAPQRRYVLDGLFDIGNVRTRYSEALGVEYCYVDIKAVS